MGEMYEVKKGDYLAKIAKEHGIADWTDIYKHDKNKKFKEKRPNPNILLPGEKIYIPDVTYRSGRTHNVDVAQDEVIFKLQIITGENPEPIYKYELKTKGKKEKTYTRSIDDNDKDITEKLDNGYIVEEISTGEEAGELKIWLYDDPDPHLEYEIVVGGLDPLEEISGIQARLNNLGFFCGEVDGKNGPKTKKGVKAFQKKYELAVDGIAGPNTQAKLKKIYGF